MRRLVFIGSLLWIVACGELLSPTDEEETPPTRSPPDGGPAITDSASGDSVTPSTGAGPLCASPTPRFIAAKEDTSAIGCAVSISYGNAEFANIGFDGVGLMYLKFDIPPDIADALAAGRLGAARLVLVEDPGPGVHGAGALAAHVLRNDWVAGVGDPPTYGGADLCRRDIGNPGGGWGNGGSASSSTRITADIDYDVTIGAQAFTAADAQVTIRLDLPSFRDHWKKRAPAGGTLSLMVEEIQNGVFVAASSDSKSLTKPTIIFDVCP